MAHTSCPSGHGMWDGNGKPVVWAFRVGYIREFVKEHPDCILSDDGPYWQMYDIVDDAIGEDLDCWYCDECKGLTVFVDLARYDFKRYELIPEIHPSEYATWEDYIAQRESDFEDFQEYYEGMNPLDAIETYPFEYRYKVSPDKKTIIALNKNDKIAFAYWRCMYQEFSPSMEIVFKSEDSEIVYTPYASYKDKLDIVVREKQYAFVKDGRAVIIDEILEQGRLYKGRDINIEGLPEVLVRHEEISSLTDEICKAVIVE